MKNLADINKIKQKVQYVDKIYRVCVNQLLWHRVLCRLFCSYTELQLQACLHHCATTFTKPAQRANEDRKQALRDAYVTY